MGFLTLVAELREVRVSITLAPQLEKSILPSGQTGIFPSSTTSVFFFHRSNERTMNKTTTLRSFDPSTKSPPLHRPNPPPTKSVFVFGIGRGPCHGAVVVVVQASKAISLSTLHLQALSLPLATVSARCRDHLPIGEGGMGRHNDASASGHPNPESGIAHETRARKNEIDVIFPGAERPWGFSPSKNVFEVRVLYDSC